MGEHTAGGRNWSGFVRGMLRFLGIALATVVLLGAILHGVVLNGFGLFGTDEAPPVAAPSESAPPEPAPPPPRVPASGPVEDPAPAPPPAREALAGEDPLPPPERVARNVTPPNVLQLPTSRYVEPGSGPPKPAEPEEIRPRRYHRVVVADAGTLKAGGTVIRLAGIAPVPAGRMCTDGTGQDWPCGRAAAAALRMLIRNRAIDCSETAPLDDGIAATCSVGLQDINGWLVEHGWAEPEAEDYADAGEAARKERRGVYAAEWRAGAPTPPVTAPLSAFTAPQIPPEPVPGAPTPATPTPAAPTPAVPGGAPTDLAPSAPVQ